ncbi:unnamed protein product [Brachionus calyciflorus]|uniref:Protein-tyrosine sulfotransferase n=1 Tax=Brachionus calyciflorus TaxID=104777 RepID=A0A814CB17_9BILA|nr:unnamed protein product [Brachionus calyciflorus]
MDMDFKLKKIRFSSKLLKNFAFYFLIVYCLALFKSNTIIKSNLDRVDSSEEEHDSFNSSLIFIGGYARSGTTLIRAILDVHDDVNCGPETKIIPQFLEFYKKFFEKQFDSLKKAKIKIKTTELAAGKFIYKIMKDISNNSKLLCTKDPNILYHMRFLHSLFPNSKFVYMVRDPRAVVYSLMKIFNESLVPYKISSYLSTWKWYNNNVKTQCDDIGPEYCKIIKYEDLIVNSTYTIKEVVKFLGISWIPEFLSHDKYIGSKVIVSETEWSTDQIKKPINPNSINAWKSKYKLFFDTLNEHDKEFLKKFNYTL